MLKRLEFFLTLVGVAIAAVTFYVTFLEKHSDIEFRYLGSGGVLGLQDSSLSDVKIFLGQREVHSLNRQDFLVLNSGSKPISKADIVSPIVIAYPQGAHILFAKVAGTEPPGFPITFTIDPTADRSAVVDFPLLNPGDTAYFSLYLYDSKADKPTVTGRIQGVKEIQFTEHTDSRTLNWLQRYLPLPLRLSLSALSSVLLGAFIVFSLNRSIKLTKTFRAVKEWDNAHAMQLAAMEETAMQLPEPPEGEWLRTPWQLPWLIGYAKRISQTKRHLLEREVIAANIPPRPTAEVTQLQPLIIQLATFTLLSIASCYTIIALWLLPRY